MINKDEAKKLGLNIVDSQKEQNPLYENLKSNFPQTIDSDGKPSLQAIATLLGISDKADMQGYELTFSGKGLANALYSTPCAKELKLDSVFKNPPYQVSPLQTSETRVGDLDLPQNTIIRGDNLDVLKLLKSAYSEKIKMIYIDPPYNTKNDNFIYPDDFRDDYHEILKEVGLLLEDENGEWVESESLRFFKNITGSKSHSGWLCFMLPRLKLARDLLREDGVIFISIDDNEQANLKILCDEIFGEENFVACMPRITKKAGKSTNQIANNHDYILCYSKNETTFKQIEVDEQDYKLQDEYYSERGGYKLNQTLDYDSLQYNQKMDFEIIIKDKKYYPGGYDKFLERQNGKYGGIDWVWRWSKEKFDFGLKMNFIEIRNHRIYTKTYSRAKISDKKPYRIEYINRTKNVSSIELISNQYSNDYANKGLQKIFNQKNIFDYSKSVELIKFLVSQISTKEGVEPDLILDFFAGSGTTAQAVMELNAEDGGNRQFILVQIDEEIKEDKSKTAYDFCKNELKSENPAISDITIERVKRAGEKIIKENPNFKGDAGFSVYSLCDKPSLVCDEEGHLKLLAGREGIKPSDIARNLALQCGKELDKPLECIIESKLYKCEDMYCVVECDKEVLETLSETKNEYIFIDGYADIKLEAFLNLKNSANISERLKIVY